MALINKEKQPLLLVSLAEKMLSNPTSNEKNSDSLRNDRMQGSRQRMLASFGGIRAPQQMKDINPLKKRTTMSINPNVDSIQNQTTNQKLAFASNGHPMTNNAWIKTSSGDTYMIGPDSRMRKFSSDGSEDTNFRERKLSSLEKNLGAYNRSMQAANKNTNPYEITNSSWTPEETARFMKTPVHGGAYRVSAPQTSFLASLQAKQNADKQTVIDEPKMPKFTAPGFTGKARLARIYSQQQEWLKSQQDQKYKLAQIGMQTDASERNNIRNNETDQEQSRNNSQSIPNRNKKLNKNQQKNLLGKWKHITYTDPITNETTAKLYNEVTGDLKDITSTKSNDAISEFLNSLKSEGK